MAGLQKTWERSGTLQTPERQGAVDSRRLQQLAPVVTLQEVHKTLAVGASDQQQAQQRRSSDAAATAATAASAAAQSNMSSSSRDAADVPEGVSPAAWSAMLQTAKEFDMRGVFDPAVNKLRSSMMQQVKVFKEQQQQQQQQQAVKAGQGAGLAAALASKQPMAAASAAASAQQLQDTSSLAGRLDAACQQVIASLPVLRKLPHTAASVASVNSRATNRTGLTNRTRRAGTAASTAARQRQQQQQDLQQQQPQQQQQQQQELPALYAVQEQRSPLGPASQLSRSALQQLEQQAGHSMQFCAEDGSSSGCSSSCKPAVCPHPDAATALNLGVLAWQQQSSSSSRCIAGSTAGGMSAAQAVNRSGCTSTTRSGRSGCCSPVAALTQRSGNKPLQQPYQQCLEQVQEQEGEGLQQSKPQRRLAVRQKRSKSLAACVAELTAAARPSTPTDHAAESAVQQRLSPAACEAFQQSVAAAVDNNLRLYRQRLQQAQQQLLQRELAGEQTQQHAIGSSSSSQVLAAAEGGSSGSKQLEAAAAGVTDCVASSAAGRDEASRGSAASGAEGPRAAAAAIGVDAAVLTMQQLVALLAKRDVQPEQEEGCTPDSKQQAAGKPAQPASATSTASHKLAAAQTMSQLLEAANEHLHAAALKFADPATAAADAGGRGSMRLDLGRIAAVHQMGKAWQRTARSNQSNASSTSSTSRGSGQQSGAATNRSNGGGTNRLLLPLPQPIAPGDAPSSTAAAASQARTSCAGSAAAPHDTQQSTQSTAAAAASNSSAARLPAGFKAAPPPRLAAPSADELAAVPLPSLPPLLDLSHEPAKVLQARLARV
uniref:Uncharacterized protein n=1 Tax=Tetradesmus obliquus TaxID=3088 RepID=A0A383V4W5_TETOB